MTIEEIIYNRPELANEKAADYIQHINPDGEKGGWRHKTALIGKNVLIGEGSIVLQGSSMGDGQVLQAAATLKSPHQTATPSARPSARQIIEDRPISDPTGKLTQESVDKPQSRAPLPKPTGK